MGVVQFRSDFDVDLVDHMGDDESIIRSAKVSTLGSKEVQEMTPEQKLKFIYFLVRNRHGSPFEHVTFTWRITAPIFVWREFMRHRVSSYSEESGRYKQLDPVLYVPSRERPIVQVGKAGAYTFEQGEGWLQDYTSDKISYSSYIAYANYRRMLDNGVAREVARMVLPVNIYSTAYVTMNLRALTNFVSLRTQDEDSTFPSFPMWEIEQVARAMEASVQDICPITMKAFRTTGSVPL